MTGPDPRATAIIPARLGSERFPRKVLASDTGTPLIVHVCEAAAQASLVSRVIVAAGEGEIVDAVTAAGFEAALTRGDHQTGTSRVAEVADTLDASDNDIIVNVQGDEPEIEPGVIDAGIRAIAGSDAPVATIATPFDAADDPANPNIVKAVVDRSGHALMFSRSVIPHDRDGSGDVSRFRHVGLYVYRRWFLARIAELEPSPLEQAERLEQLRFLEHGYRIAVAIEEARGVGIDSPEQYAAFVKRWTKQQSAAHGRRTV
ncbi:MAG: 3-deoxy-manno-octulosonate cytidylyltransferase [Planctomycetota bacterium]